MRNIGSGENAARAQPASITGMALKPWVKCLEVLRGMCRSNKRMVQRWQKMVPRARALPTLPLGTEEKTYLMASWVARTAIETMWWYQMEGNRTVKCLASDSATCGLYAPPTPDTAAYAAVTPGACQLA